MILHLHPDIAPAQLDDMARTLRAAVLQSAGTTLLVTPSALKTVPAAFASYVAAQYPMDSDIQLASRSYLPQTRAVELAPGLWVGGDHRHTAMIAGPCSVESRTQIEASAAFVHGLGIRLLRGGCYKPRTSPYTFQGLGREGLELLAEMRDRYGLAIVTEVRDATHVEDVIAYADIVQIGAKAMYDHGILRRCGEIRKPVLLKRGFGSTLQEFVQAAEFILSGGNEQVLLCERGIRTFETKTRFTLDLCGVAYLKEYTNLPVVLDPSHAMGYRYGVADLARACVAMGVDGLLIETHPDPAVAQSDAAQQLDFPAFEALYRSLAPITQAVGYQLT
ncbi:MAG: 3-deoxy-7-phosphoheptulonate synthase [Bacteroidia bacterium]